VSRAALAAVLACGVLIAAGAARALGAERTTLAAPAVSAAAAVSPAAATPVPPTLAAVRAAGVLKCGINRAEADYSKDDTHGNLAAFAADLCKAVAVATLGPAAHVIATGFGDEPHALAALQAGGIDLVAGASPSVTHRVVYGVRFGPPMYLDGQGFLIRDASTVKRLEDFAGKQICFIGGTSADVTLNAVMSERQIAFIPFPFEEQGEMEAALFTGHCAAVTGDLSQLADTLYGFQGGRGRFRVGTDVIREDPLAPAYREGDPQWAAIVDATMAALVKAEADAVTTANAAALQQSGNPEIRRLLGSTPGVGSLLGLDDHWALNVIEAVGNYGEIFDRDLGARSPLKLERGANRPRSLGGALIETPLQ
jgi:general L-amino acid transport system substrate-binding protein